MLSTALFAALALLQGAAQTPPVQAPMAAPKPVPAPDAVVATINGKPVTAAEVEPFLWSWQARLVIEEMAQHRAVAEEAAKRGLTVTDAEVKERVDAQLAGVQKTLPAGQTVDDFLATRRLTREHLVVGARTTLLLDKIVEADFHPADYVKMDALLFQAPPSAAPEVQAKAVKGADAAFAALASNKPWDTVFKANTTQPNAAAVGGAIPWTPLASLPDSLRGQVALLKPQGYTKPTPVPNGVQIYHLAARGNDAPPAEIAAVKAQYMQGARAALLQRLKEATKVEVK